MRTLVIAPHPDDEILGCGGLLLRRIAEGVRVGWVIMTSIHADDGWDAEQVSDRQLEIVNVAEGIGLRPDDVFNLGIPSTKLDQYPRAELVRKLSGVFDAFKPNEVLTPHSGDVHSDHEVTAQVVSACTKWFRHPSVKRVLAYETLSETGLNVIAGNIFTPNFFVDISPWLERKLALLRIYESEVGDFPFPRSEQAVRALAEVRGASSGFDAAEAYELLREIRSLNDQIL
jgi:LmbE family N-acetylglucosaminyl deacetylase